jgi:hypothetical protein
MKTDLKIIFSIHKSYILAMKKKSMQSLSFRSSFKYFHKSAYLHSLFKSVKPPFFVL